MTRAEILQLIQDNILDNSSKLITAAMVREVLEAIENSGFNVDSDLLKNLNYDAGKTMAQLVSELQGALPLFGLTGAFAFGGSSGAIAGNTGIVQSATKTRLGNEDTKVTVVFDQAYTGKHAVVNIMTDSPDINASNDIGAPVVRKLSNSIEVGLRSFGGIGPTSLRLQVLLFGNQ